MQLAIADIGGDDERPADETDFGDDLSGCSVEGGTLDDELRFAGLAIAIAIALALDDLAREDKVSRSGIL